ncbi:MAG: tRNA (adenosine(37)-N6)-threonylcarbamoyltransferase complex ATPase subunit type 1 TsaE [Geminicoccaceae bacterium]|nr:tRNA (adenosine(37)-N6)-threonylcarbamoyltransferase complex ATPase subunit type 1 TsaE [Geminicoccaceae bacterium]
MSDRPDRSSPITTAIELNLGTLEATRALGRNLAGRLRIGDIVRLEGDLGAGKSELARAIIQARSGAAIEVPSPTFTLVQPYVFVDLTILHADLYRLGTAEEIFELGIIEALDDSCLLVEWPDQAADLLPETGLRIILSHGTGLSRHARIEALDRSWLDRMPSQPGES